MLIATSLLTQPFHRTETLDFGIVMKGQITLVLDNNERQVCKPGDVIVADEDGVVWVPAEIDLDDLIRTLRMGRVADENCMKDIEAGLGVQESFKKHRGK